MYVCDVSSGGFPTVIGRDDQELESGDMKSPPIEVPEMDPYSTITELTELAEQVGLPVRISPAADATEHPGGAVVRLRGQDVLFLDPGASTADQLAVLAGALRDHPGLDDRFVKPSLRDIIEGDTR